MLIEKTDSTHSSSAARVVLVLRLILGGVFFMSGIAKLFSPQEASVFISLVVSVSSKTAIVLAVILSSAEILLSLSLILGKKIELAAFASATFFIGALLVGLIYLGEDTSCGCFGELIPSKTNEFFVARNVGFLLLSLLLLKSSSSRFLQFPGAKDEQTQ